MMGRWVSVSQKKHGKIGERAHLQGATLHEIRCNETGWNGDGARADSSKQRCTTCEHAEDQDTLVLEAAKVALAAAPNLTTDEARDIAVELVVAGMLAERRQLYMIEELHEGRGWIGDGRQHVTLGQALSAAKHLATSEPTGFRRKAKGYRIAAQWSQVYTQRIGVMFELDINGEPHR